MKYEIFNGNVFILIIDKINTVAQKIFKQIKDDKFGEKVGDPIRDRTINNLLLLYVIARTNKKGKLEDNLKLQKLVFLIQKNLIQRKLKGFSYDFFRWKKGPFSAGLNDDLKLLKDKFIKWEKDRIYLTEEGRNLLSECKEIFEKNHIFAKSFNSTIDEFATVSPDELKDIVYRQSMFVPILRRVMLIEKIPKRRIMLFKPQERKMRQLFEVEEGREAALELMFDREALVSLQKAYDDAKEGRHGESIRVHTS